MSEIQAKIHAMGHAFTPAMIQASAALFAPLLPSYDEAAVRRDIKYGPDQRHRLDVFGAIRDGNTKRPVVIFIHGGGFVMGDKGNAGEPFFNNVGVWASKRGWLGVTATYRLAPAHKYPAGAEDMRGIVDWVRSNIAEYGGDPRRIVLIGQSAGASHVAAYLARAQSHSMVDQCLAGAVMMSGVYDPGSFPASQFETAYYGDDASFLARCSSLDGLASTPVPCLFTIGENEDDKFQGQGALLVARWVAAKGRWPHFHLLEAENHITPVHQIGSLADEVGPLIAKFVAKVTA